MAKRGFLALPIQPLQKLFKPKHFEISFEMLFYPTFCYIKEELADGENRDTWLTIAYICYLAKYFYICDSRQRESMIAAYTSLFKLKEVDYKDFIGFVEGQVFQTLNEQEKKAKNGLFTMWSPPPFMLIDEEQTDTKRLGKYSFGVARGKSGGIVRHLVLSFGMDMVLLPHSLALFHQYVTGNLSSARHKELLNKLSLALVDSLHETKPSVKWEKDTPERLLKKAGLL